MNNTYNDLQLILKNYMTEEDVEYIHSVYLFTKSAHEDQRRKSGEAYITHPVAVGCILSMQKLPASVIVSGLLHDVVEDTKYTTEDIVELFGIEIANIVEGVTKLGNIEGSSLDDQQAANHRKIIISASKDIRVILVKLADRLHNMMTIGYMNDSKQKIIANETLEVYAPIAHRLGMYKIKWELEDLSFKVVNPTEYSIIANKLDMKRSEREKIVNQEVQKFETILDSNKLDFFITGRSKHIYSIYKKMVSKKQEFEDLTDLIAFRIIVKTIPECYIVLGLLHENYKPIPKRFKDYIPTPKHNMYQSIHTTVIAEDGMPIEVQIRTEKMDYVAENGIASHWSYKNIMPKEELQKKINEQLKWLQEAEKLGEEDIGSKEFMNILQGDYFSKSIFVYTPKGDVIELPENSTVLDFAFYIHTELGYKAISSKVNEKFVSLFYKLKIGDVVTVVTSHHSQPEVEWIHKVKTTRAKDSLKKYFKDDQKKLVRNEGYHLLHNYLKSKDLENFEKILEAENLETIMMGFAIKNQEDLYYHIGVGDILISDIINYFNQLTAEKVINNDLPVVITDDHKFKIDEYIYCRYCSPVVGDEIKVVKINDNFYIHRNECEQDFATYNAKWTMKANQSLYKSRLYIEVKDEPKALIKVLEVIANKEINLTSIYARGEDHERSFCKLIIKVHNLTILNQIIKELDDLEVTSIVQRVNSSNK